MINRILLTAILVCTLGGCTVSGQPTRQLSASKSSHALGADIRQTDAARRPLPFSNSFPNRWNGNNDGTSYEPCTADARSAREALGIDESTVRDVAVADHQTARGCRWKFKERRLASLGQSLGNFDGSLSDYKAEPKLVKFSFREDRVIHGRLVSVFTIENDTCSVAVKSGKAIIVTSVDIIHQTPRIDSICQMAIDYTRATIDQMPK